MLRERNNDSVGIMFIHLNHFTFTHCTTLTAQFNPAELTIENAISALTYGHALLH